VSLNQFINVALGMAVGRAGVSTPMTYPKGKRQPEMTVREKKNKKIVHILFSDNFCFQFVFFSVSWS
jgi:hypothetical protein